MRDDSSSVLFLNKIVSLLMSESAEGHYSMMSKYQMNTIWQGYLKVGQNDGHVLFIVIVEPLSRF